MRIRPAEAGWAIGGKGNGEENKGNLFGPKREGEKGGPRILTLISLSRKEKGKSLTRDWFTPNPLDLHQARTTRNDFPAELSAPTSDLLTLHKNLAVQALIGGKTDLFRM